MKKLIIAIFAISAICFAQSSEKCNPNPNSEPGAPNHDSNIPDGWCYNEGYVCQLSIEATGGVRFVLGKNPTCLGTELESTHFVVNHVNNDGSTTPLNFLQPYFQEGPVDNVSALSVAINTALLINASNEKFKIRIMYHQITGDQTENGLRLLGISRKQIITP